MLLDEADEAKPYLTREALWVRTRRRCAGRNGGDGRMELSADQIEEYCRLANGALEESNRDMHRILLYTEDPQDEGDPQTLAVACIGPNR